MNNSLGANTCAYDRNAMLNGQSASQTCFASFEKASLLPSDLDGSMPPPTGSPNYMLNFGSNSLRLFKFHVDFGTPSNSTLTGPTVIPVAAFTPLCNGGRNCAPQSGTTTQLDSLADRLMYRPAYHNFGSHESLVVNHSVAVGSGGGIRWYEIQSPNGTPNVVQQSTFAPDGNFRWMGSIAMDQAGDIALGYSVSGTGINPAIAITGHAISDSPSTMEAETVVIDGAGSQANGLTRWGDYSAMQVDPVDDCTFWYTNEYLKTTGSFNWNTRIANFKFPNCKARGPTSFTSYTLGVSAGIVFIDQNQHVRQLAWNGSAWFNQDLTMMSGTSIVAALGSGLTSYSLSTADVQLVYVGSKLYFQAVARLLPQQVPLQLFH